MRLVENLIPPGGFHYYNGDVRLVGESESDIISIIKQYRAANNLPAGDAKADYLAYVCGNFPQNCHSKQYYHETSPVPATRRDELMDDVRDWVSNRMMSQEPIKLVSDQEAERRAQICLSCPKNISWKTKTCAPCIQAIESNCSSVRQARSTYSSSKLGGCLHLRHDNATSVFLEHENFNNTKNLPSKCWINQK